MSTPSTTAYLTTKVMSASQEELRLMLLDGAIKFARQGLDGINTKNFEQSFTGVSQCRNIVLELLNTIRDAVDPDLAHRVRSVYSFLYTELIEVGMHRDPARLEKVIELLEFERETWVMLMQKLTEDRKSTRPPKADGARASFSAQA
jgi:flagellar protein FliS